MVVPSRKTSDQNSWIFAKKHCTCMGLQETCMRGALLKSVLLCTCLAMQALGQSSNARVSGTVNDASGAVLPGVEVTATNSGTGVVTSVTSNDSGAYNFASLLPGVYTITAALPSFQSQTYTAVQLGNAAQVRLNFSLQVSAVSTAVEVNADRTLIESSSSVGDVLDERKAVDLPLISNRVLDLVGVMAGVQMTNNPIFGANDTQFAGVAASNINVQRDGVPVTGGRWPTGLVDSTTEVNPDLVGEVRMILAPVDAEMGRGAGQVQIQTRSGTNQFHGGAVYNAQNSVLDANTWSDNQTGTTPAWRNLPNITARLGGPIKKNKTFFFGLYDQQWARTRSDYTALTLTPCAQRGIFRYFDNWNSAVGSTFPAVIPTWSIPTTLGGTPTTAIVDAQGNIRKPTTNPDGTPHNGILRYASVFGQLVNTPTRPDCSDAIVQGPPRDSFRTQKDPTGYVDTLFKYMPPVNNYDIGDGLNTAGHRWTRGLDGADNLFGIGEPTRRKQFNIKIDHNFNTKHKVGGAWSYERTFASDTFMTWPNTFDGHVLTKPQVLTLNFVSVLSPTLVNEARFGMTRTGTNVFATLYNPDNRDQILALLPKSGSTDFLPLLGTGQVNFQIDQIVGTRGFTPQPVLRDSTPRKVWGDTVSLTSGKHAFRFGGEYRRGSSKYTVSSTGGASAFPCSSQFLGFDGDPITPVAYGGVTPLAPVTGVSGTGGLAGNSFAGNVQRMENLLTFLSGSLCSVAQYRFINTPDQAQKAWNDPAKDPYKIRDFQQNEFGTFFKDDWKISPKWTLNLGLRWDYYGPPWEKHGLTSTLRDQGAGLFGISGRSFENWMMPGARAPESELIFVGPNTPNESLQSYPRDLNNFGPAVGFAWNFRTNTVIRGGYQVQYIGGGNFASVDDALGSPPGSTFLATYSGDSSNPYLDMTSIKNGKIPVPIAPPVLPVQQIPITNRATAIQAYDPNYVSPYIQNLTLSVTRTVSKNFTVDARYIGTLTRKNFNAINLNSPNFQTNGLKTAFDAARTGGESTLLNQMFQGINVAGTGCMTAQGAPVTCAPVGTVNGQGVLQTGAMHLRALGAGCGFGCTVQGALANGDYASLATALASLNYSTLNAGNENLPFVPFGVNGSVLRYNKFDENFILTNPQFSTATYLTNAAHSNYHSLQVLGTLRPTAGFSLQGSYTWSKNLGDPVGGVPFTTFTDPRNRSLDYALLSTHRAHVFRTYGTFDLPVGPGQLFAKNTTGFVARLIEGWQTSWIVNLSSGQPLTMLAQSMLYGSTTRGTPDQVRPFDFKGTRGVRWPEGAPNGTYFGDVFTKVRDPQCLSVAASLQGFCTLNAIADKSGNIILQHPQTGTVGNVGQQSIEGAGVWTADMAIAKSFKINETFRAQVRADAKNVFNHPTPGAPAAAFGAAPIDGGAILNVNDVNPFGSIPLKGASVPQFPSSRQFQLKVRVDF